jgi:hypothetical protein
MGGSGNGGGQRWRKGQEEGHEVKNKIAISDMLHTA